MPGLTCPQCDSGFIEEISPEFEEERRESASETASGANPVTDALFDIWGRHFLASLGAINPSNDPRRDPFTDSSSSSSAASDDDGGLTETGGRTSSTTTTAAPGAARTRSSRDGARTRLLFGNGGDASGGRGPRLGSGDPNPFLQGMIANILQNLTQSGPVTGAFMNGAIPISVGGAGGGAIGGFPMNMFQIHGNPGDYAWGSGGLDAVISQLLNQLDSTGAPPAPRETIDQLPKVKITKEQVEIKLQCSVCMEDYKIDETVHKLPCDHLFHENCIVPWLELHDTCPVCRKGLTEGSDQNDGSNEDDDGGDDGGGNSRRQSAPGLDRIFGGGGGNINIIFSPPGNNSSSGGGGSEDPLDQVELPVYTELHGARSEQQELKSGTVPCAVDSSHFLVLVLAELKNFWSTGMRTHDSMLTEGGALFSSQVIQG